MYVVNIVEREVCHKGMNAIVLQIFLFYSFIFMTIVFLYDRRSIKAIKFYQYIKPPLYFHSDSTMN